MITLGMRFAGYARRWVLGESAAAAAPGGRAARRPRGRPRRRPGPVRLEALEDRTVPSPVILDPNLGVRTVVQLGAPYAAINPTNMAFLGDNEFFLAEKTTGKLDHVIDGVVDATRFDFGQGAIPNLPVNNNSERGLLGIALSPDFATDHDVYLYWTQSSTGAVSALVQEVPLLGNRVDRFIWNPATSTLTFDRNIVSLHAFQNDGNNLTGFAGNHNGGVIHFGPDGKLYIVIGDNGRRGWMQNLVNGPIGPGHTDENFGSVRGGPAPDNAHLTGVLLRLNPDGTTPSDNPFTDIRTTLQAPVLGGANERPAPNGSPGTGSFTVFLNQAMDALTVNVTFDGLSAPTLAGGARIHVGGPDASGPVILPLHDFPAGLTSGEFTTTLTAADLTPGGGVNTFADAVQAILNGNAYFNIPTTQFTGGEIRGQIAQLDPTITTNLHKVFAYGIRNSFGFDFDPLTGRLWLEENGDVSFDKLSIVDPGANNGWVQSSPPLVDGAGAFDETAFQEFKSIEMALNPSIQQVRYPVSRLANSAAEAYNRLLLLPGSHYNPSVFSVRYEDPPAGLGFLTSSALGAQYQNTLFEGEARDSVTDPREEFDGALFNFRLTTDRSGIDFGDDPNIRSTDHVFENFSDFDLNGDTSYLLGTGFGILTGIQTGPDGNLYLVSETKNAVYEVYPKGGNGPFHSTNLVADTADPTDSTGAHLGAPEVVDANLKNPWGNSFSGSSPFWLADAGSGKSTLYSGDHLQPDGTVSPIAVSSTVVSLPAPTGTVNNSSTTDFLLSNGTRASFLFDSLGGSIYGWNGGATAELKAHIDGAVYTGLAIGNNGSGNYLYAADVAGGTIDVYDTHFALVSPGPNSFVFADPSLPAGLTPWAPFNVQNLDGTLYVTYQNRLDPEHGGIVDAFDTNGNFLRRVVSGGLNAPWGLALAPAGFGNFGGALLVGNFGLGDGKINAYDPLTGQFLGYVADADGTPLAFEGLWSIAFGNGGSGGDRTALYVAAGIDRNGPGSFGAQQGLFASIRYTPPGDSGRGPVHGRPLAQDGPAKRPADGGDLAGLLVGLEANSTSLKQRVESAPEGKPAQGLSAAEAAARDRAFGFLGVEVQGPLSSRVRHAVTDALDSWTGN